MNEKQAKAQLEKFLNGRILTFSMKNYPSGEWIAQCNEIDGIITGGMDLSLMDSLIRDAILTAAGIDVKYSNDILRNVGYASSVMEKTSTHKNETIVNGLAIA